MQLPRRGSGRRQRLLASLDRGGRLLQGIGGQRDHHEAERCWRADRSHLGTKCQTAAGGNVSPSAGSTTNNRVNFAAGTGTVNPATDTGTISWDGDFTIVFYGGLTYWTVSDPVLNVVNGVGTLEGTASGYGTSMEDMTQWVPIAPEQIDLATFDGVVITATGVSVTPDYAGVEVTTAGTPQNRTAASWGSFPQSIVDFNNKTGQSSYWDSSGGAADPKKVAKGFSATYAEIVTPEVPGTPDGNVDVVIPEFEEPIDPETGSFSWAWADPNGANLGTAVQTGDNFVANGSISDVAVIDTRAGGTASYGWTVSGQSTDFSNGTDTISAANLGWAPKLAEGTSPSVTKGAAVTGLNTAQQLATSNAAANATLGADLTLTVPTTTKQGAYSATLTIASRSPFQTSVICSSTTRADSPFSRSFRMRSDSLRGQWPKNAQPSGAKASAASCTSLVRDSIESAMVRWHSVIRSLRRVRGGTHGAPLSSGESWI